VVRHALREVGEDDRALADYVAALVLHFGLRSGRTASARPTTSATTRWPRSWPRSTRRTCAAASSCGRTWATTRSG
jgi:hypothetical protein